MYCQPGLDTPTPTYPNNASASNNKSNKRIDFLSELPLDVVMYNIVPRILSEGPTPFRLDIPNNYLDVCRTWCKRIMMVAGSMYCGIGSLFLISKQQERRLETAAPYVKRLAIATINEKCINQLANTVKFSSLNELTITMNGSQTAFHHFFSTLANLTYLEIIYDNQVDGPFQVYDILDQCANLARLDLTLGEDTTMVISSDNQHTMYYNLVHLQAICKEKSKCDMFIPLLRHLPNLHILQLAYPPSETAMHAIHQHCPQLQQLILSQHLIRANMFIDIVQQQQGLRLLRIDDTSFEGDYLAKLITQHHNTLESIDLHASSGTPISSFNEYRDQGTFQLKRLRSFHYEARRSPDYIPFIEWVVNHAPNLESVKLICGLHEMHNLRTLMHRALKRIELACEPFDQPDHWQYLQHHIQLGNESHLKEVKCYISVFIRDSSWMYLIPQLNHLKSLELDFQHGLKALEPTTFMTELSRGCDALETLTIIGRRFTSDVWIHPLLLHGNLRKLVIHGSQLSDEVLLALEQFHHLECLHLELYKIHWNAMARLRRRVPHLQCTLLEE